MSKSLRASADFEFLWSHQSQNRGVAKSIGAVLLSATKQKKNTSKAGGLAAKKFFNQFNLLTRLFACATSAG